MGKRRKYCDFQFTTTPIISSINSPPPCLGPFNLLCLASWYERTNIYNQSIELEQ